MVEYVRMGYRRAAVCGHMTVLRSGELAMDSCQMCPTERRTAAPLDLEPTNGAWCMQFRCLQCEGSRYGKAVLTR